MGQMENTEKMMRKSESLAPTSEIHTNSHLPNDPDDGSKKSKEN